MFVDRLPAWHRPHRPPMRRLRAGRGAGRRHLRQRRPRHGRRRGRRRRHPLDAAAVRGRARRRRCSRARSPIAGMVPAASVAWPPGAMRNWLGTGQALPGVSRARRPARQLCRLRQRPKSRRKESWSAPGDPAALAREFAGWDPMVEAIIAPGEDHVPLGPLRPRAAADLDQRAPDAAGRCRPPDAAARRPGRQPGHRGRRGAGRRAGPRRPGLGAARAADLRAAAARADRRRAARSRAQRRALRCQPAATWSARPAARAQPRSAPGSGTTTPRRKLRPPAAYL